MALTPHRAEIEGWVGEGRSDEWIASYLGTSPSSVQSFRSRRGIMRQGGRQGQSPLTERPSGGNGTSTFEGVLDQGEEDGYGLWLDPAVADDPIFQRCFGGVSDVRVTIREDRIVLEPLLRDEEEATTESPAEPSDAAGQQLERLFGSERLRQAVQSSPTTNRERGKVKFFDPAKGYGFISRPGGADLFVHRSETRDVNELEVGLEVTYEIGSNQRGLLARGVEAAG